MDIQFLLIRYDIKDFSYEFSKFYKDVNSRMRVIEGYP